MSVAIGASAAGARDLHRDRQPGPALHGRGASTTPSGLGLPIVMTVANRAIGAPINIWNDHSDSMCQRDCGWIQLYAETNQEAARPARPGVPARRGAVAAGDGVHGRLRPHPRRTSASTSPTQDAGRRLPAAVRAAPGARPGRPGDDRRDGRARRRSPRCATSRTPSSSQALERDPARRRRVRRRASAATPAGCSRRYRCEDAETVVVALGSVLGTLKDTVDELRDRA